MPGGQASGTVAGYPRIRKIHILQVKHSLELKKYISCDSLRSGWDRLLCYRCRTCRYRITPKFFFIDQNLYPQPDFNRSDKGRGEGGL